MAEAPPSRRRQVLGSFVAAVVIVVLVVALVIAKIGPGVETRERRDEAEELLEIREERREELIEEREEFREENRGPG